MKKIFFLIILFFVTSKAYCIIFWQPYPITATVTVNGPLERIECSVYDSVLGSWQYYNTPYYNDSVLINMNTATIITFNTCQHFPSAGGDSIYGFIIYDQELHQFMPNIKSHSDRNYNGAGLNVYDNTVRVYYSNSIPNTNWNSDDFIDLYIYNIITHSWSGGLMVSAFDFWDENCSIYPAVGGMSYTIWNDDWDTGPYYTCNFYDPVTSLFSSFTIWNYPNWYASSVPIYDNQDAMAWEDWPWQNAYAGSFDPALHGWSGLSFGEVDIGAKNGIFVNDGGLSLPTIGIYDDSLHQWAVDTVWGSLVKDRVVTHYNNNKIYFEVFSPTLRAWVKDSSVTNGIDTIFIEEGTVHWTDTNSVSYIAGYNDTIGWGNFNTPLLLNFHVTDFYNSTGYPLIYVRDYSIGSDSTWYTFGDGIETEPGLQHSLWHLFKVNGKYSASPSNNDVCIHANTSAGLQTWCENKPEPCSASIQSHPSCPTTCNGSVAVINATGANPFTYLWSNGNSTDHLDSLCTGDYSVTITDSTGCTVSNSFHISELTVASSSSSIHCTNSCNGAAYVFVSGGATPYDYNWSTGDSLNEISNLCAGNYSVTVTDNNQCTSTASVNITVDNPLSLFLSIISQPDCNNSDAWIEYQFSGGTSPFTISVTPNIYADTSTVNNHFVIDLYSFSSLPPGIYTTTITDVFGCSITLIDTIVSYVPITAFSVTGLNPSCNGVCDGGFISNVIGGNPPLQYHTCSGAALTSGSMCAGTYCVMVEDSYGCTASTTLALSNLLTLNCFALYQNPSCIGCSDGFIVVYNSGGTPPYSIAWTPNNGFISGDTIYNLPAGSYSVTITDTNGCNKTIGKTLVDPPVSIGELSNDDAIVISPNPAFGQFTIYHNVSLLRDGVIEIYNVIGEKIYSSAYDGIQTINCKTFAKGIYFVRIVDGEKQVTKKLVVE